MFERERYTGCIYDTAPRFFIVFYSLKYSKDVVLFSGGEEEIMGTLKNCIHGAHCCLVVVVRSRSRHVCKIRLNEQRRDSGRFVRGMI